MSGNIKTYDVVIVGRMPVALDEALTLAGARWSVLVTGADGQDRDKLAPHGGEATEAVAVGAERADDGVLVTLADGSRVMARQVLAAGDGEPPDLPGVRERWGRDVLHDPYEQGRDIRDRRIAVLATGRDAARQALLWRQWSERVTLLLHTAPEPTGEEYGWLACRDVALINGKVTGLEVTGDVLAGVTMADGRVIPCEVLVAAPRMVPWPDAGEIPWVGSAREAGAALAEDDARRAAAARPVPFSIEAEREAARRLQRRRLAQQYASEPEEASRTQGTGEARDVSAPDASGARRTTQDPSAQDASDAREWWDARYRERGRIWSGRPNLVLSREVPGLTPGTALDLGCGEGADAIWLARQGWRVTAADISGVALERAAQEAAEAGVADSIDFQRHDFSESFPEGSYDLVSAHYLHSYQELPRERILRAAAAAVAPGGVLLIVSHQDWPTWQHDHPDVAFPTARQVLDALDLADGEWEVELCEAFERRHDAPDGTPGSRTDNVVRARRLDPAAAGTRS